MYRFREYLNNPGLIWIGFANHGFFNWMSDERYLSIKYRIIFQKKINLDNPKSFNEKIQWLKIHDRKPEYTIMVDKYEVKNYVKNLIGEQYIIPTLGVWKHFDDIDFNTLPDQFVLKCTHDSGGLVIVRDRSTMDMKAAKIKLEKCLRKNFYHFGREWPYKDVKPRIIAEKYMEDTTSNDLKDYKFFTFDGVAKALFIASDRQSSKETKFDFYDMNFNHLNLINGHPNSDKPIAKPETFDTMRELAEKISKGIPHCRVDFYEVNGQTYFGEITFSHWSGFVPFEPEEWDKKFGEWIQLPKQNGGVLR